MTKASRSSARPEVGGIAGRLSEEVKLPFKDPLESIEEIFST